MSRCGVTDALLLHEVEGVEDLYYQNAIQKITTNFVPCFLGAGSLESLPSGAFNGDAASHLTKNLQAGIYDFYLCGEREMIQGVILLADEHFAGSHVYTEVFY